MKKIEKKNHLKIKTLKKTNKCLQFVLKAHYFCDEISIFLITIKIQLIQNDKVTNNYRRFQML